jgi:hypothetical protein
MMFIVVVRASNLTNFSIIFITKIIDLLEYVHYPLFAHTFYYIYRYKSAKLNDIFVDFDITGDNKKKKEVEPFQNEKRRHRSLNWPLHRTVCEAASSTIPFKLVRRTVDEIWSVAWQYYSGLWISIYTAYIDILWFKQITQKSVI